MTIKLIGDRHWKIDTSLLLKYGDRLLSPTFNIMEAYYDRRKSKNI